MKLNLKNALYATIVCDGVTLCNSHYMLRSSVTTVSGDDVELGNTRYMLQSSASTLYYATRIPCDVGPQRQWTTSFTSVALQLSAMTLNYDGFTDVRYSPPWQRSETIAHGVRPVLLKHYFKKLCTIPLFTSLAPRYPSFQPPWHLTNHSCVGLLLTRLPVDCAIRLYGAPPLLAFHASAPSKSPRTNYLAPGQRSDFLSPRRPAAFALPVQTRVSLELN